MSESNIIDIHSGKLVAFDGKIMHDIDQNNLYCTSDNGTKFVLDIVVGILHLSSSRSLSTKKQDVIKKEFTPFLNGLPKFLVKTKKLISCQDQCVVVKVECIENGIVNGYVLEYLGALGNPDNDNIIMTALATSHWNKKINKQFESLNEIDLTPQRDIIDCGEIYTIDPKGCDDIDDALHCTKLDTGYEIGIHIADVSSYIAENSVFDIELSKRVESIYNANNQINMIPNSLSINHLSLKQSQQKRAFSIILILNDNFEIIDVQFKKTIIVVKQNISYDECEEMLKSNDLNKLNDQNNSNESFNSLKMLYDIGNKFHNELCKNDDSYDTHKMVAAFMICANKIVAEHLIKYDNNTTLLRVQYDTQNVHESCKNNDLYKNNELYKKWQCAMYERAYYKNGCSNENETLHSTLNLKYYTHFTSPIRRYADIVVHRQLWNMMNNIKSSMLQLKTLFLMNTYAKLYKRIQRTSIAFNIANNLNNNSDMFDAYIIAIKHEKNSLRLYIPKLDLEHDIEIVNKKYVHLFSIVSDNFELDFDGIKIKLFQQIKIKIIITKFSFDKINVIIKEPDLSII